MFRLKTFILFTLVYNHLTMYCQDIHWSQPFNTPLYQNPANAGEFIEDIRVNVGFKDQWRSVTKPYQTVFFSSDTKLRKTIPLGIGTTILSDITGDGSFRTNLLNLNSSYKIYLSKIIQLDLGIGLGFCNKQLNVNAFQFDNQYDGYKFNGTINPNENYQSSSFSHLLINSGFTLSYKKRDLDLKVGIGFFNLNKPKETFYNLQVIRPIRTLYYLKLSKILSNQISYSTFVTYNHQLTYNEIIIGTQICKKFTKKYNLIFGVNHRIKDAFILNLGAENEKLKAILSYDVNISKLKKASNSRGGIEITIQYLIKKKKINFDTKIQCIDYL
jgi:type IX secretion system PorP/SprF family membrane protein